MVMLYTTSQQVSYVILENMPFSIKWQQKKLQKELASYELWILVALADVPRPEISRAFPKHDLIKIV